MRRGYCGGYFGGDLRIFGGVWRLDGILEGICYFTEFAENGICD